MRQQPAVGEEERLNQQNAGHDEERGRGSKQGRQKNGSSDVSAGTGSGNREVYHLRRENKRSGDSHERNAFFLEVFPDVPNGVAKNSGGDCNHGSPDCR